jgi:hypothetical protein
LIHPNFTNFDGMRKNRFFLIFIGIFFISIGTLHATHIAGGDFSLVYSGRGYVYQVNMNMYYDDINADPLLLDADQVINVAIFSKASNTRIRLLELRRTSNNFMSYSTNGCADDGTLRTRLFPYQGSLDLRNYTEPQGYYMVWERCCRNYATKNIVHVNFWNSVISGQTFYMEFPPVTLLGERFVNSSPVFKPVPAQYLCINNYEVMDFSAVDSDGDSLVYRMVTPLRGHSNISNPSPIPSSAPYPLIGWQSGYSAANSIPGSPALGIGLHNGLLTVNPNETGLFAFAVVCEEYRNNVKIGEVRRDFQYYVRSCPPTHSPRVGLNADNNGNSGAGSTNWGNGTSDTLTVYLNRDTCYTIFVTDSSTTIYNQPDEVTIYYGETNLPRSVLTFSPNRVRLQPQAGQDTVSLNMCFSACDRVLIEKDSVYYLDIVVMDRDCPRKTDTLRTYVHVIVDTTNISPVIGTTLDPVDELEVYTNSQVDFIVYGLDSNNYDIREITVEGERFRMDDYRMEFFKIYEGPDSIAYRFLWDPTCEDLENRLNYPLKFTLKDKSCIPSHNVTRHILLKLKENETDLPNISPSNLITPNGDRLNDCFYIPNIPPDNCTYIFQSVEIYNSWGARVFKSSNPLFEWCAEDVGDGVYYYSIDLKAKKIKGWLQVVR